MNEGQGLWLMAAAVVLGAFLLTQMYRSSGKLGAARRELTRLTEKQKAGQGTPEDRAAWELHRTALRNHPSEYNKLNMEIQFEEAFLRYLEQFHPDDSGLAALRLTAGYRKDTLWGFKVNRKD
ncbi:hypothetical protein SY83_01245 [Paenibacillus swuensis]|uniref:Uncharacterized protein n=1 Tax=Paenibacillus swuensis TaxID=1178515 RepID=A0A172TEH4_9BACL|nr:hypothetical protein [Paenibacillus swuensis]ANE45183.1 hypothetical protein SY83_01245 [Paenibacillus swuensis]